MIRRLLDREVVRWGAKSAVALGLNVALLTVWVDGVGVPAALAAPLNAVLIPPAMYVVVDRWVFAERGSPDSLRGHAKQFAGMYAANSSAKVGNYLIYLGLVELTPTPYQIAWVVGAVVMFVTSFGLNRELWRRVAVQT